MTALALAILAKLWPYLIGGTALLVGAWKVRQSGVNAERSRQAQEEARARDIADQVDNDLGALTPAQARERLRQWSKQ